MENTIRSTIAKLAEKYGFDQDEAYTYLTKHDADVGSVSTTGDIPEKIATCIKNITLWQKKLDEGKVKDTDKHREKLDKEKKKLEKLEGKKPAEPAVEPPKKEAPPKKETPKKTTPKKEATPKKEDAKDEKRIKRFSPVMSTQLKAALPDGIDLSDKIKKEFQQYIEDLTDDDYRKEGLGDHMRAFAKTKAPTKMELPTDPSKIYPVSLDDLQTVMTATLDDSPGTFWDASNGRFVKGPDAEDDEDFTEVKFESKAYVVGDKTGRVYEAHDSGDVFAGFIGVGKFKAMKA
jgi:hypothetical protein